MEIPFKKTKDSITINVRVQPRSSKKGISGVSGETLKVRLTSPPVDNAANEQLIELLSEELGVKKSAISIIRGQSSRDKVVEIRGIAGLQLFS
ncbi:MAG: DUF167 domain-containing protein [Nitrospirota bacterium]